MKTSTAASVEHVFVTHLVMTYGPLILLLSNNEKKFNAKFFQKSDACSEPRTCSLQLTA